MQPNLIPIETLIPQRPPMVMVDSLLHCDRQLTQTSYTIAPDGLFISNNKLSASGLIENMAQTTAARMGYLALHGSGGTGAVRVGVIGAIKRLSVEAPPDAGNVLITSVDLIEELGDMILVKAKVECKGQIIASCEMIVSLL
ncbi:MAG: pseudouridylate synthase [Bacteroidales bacterium]|nr:pseudouridylate synthase [Bacteroidales bacterium]